MGVSVRIKNKWDIIIEKIIELIHHIEDRNQLKRLKLMINTESIEE